MDLVTNWLAFTPVFAVPLVAAALGLIINERAGVLNLGVEGIMLCGALVGVVAYIEFGDNNTLGFLFGVFGVHRFYVGKIGTGLLMFFTAGGLGVWLFIDIFLIAFGKFRDSQGLLILNPSQAEKY